MLFATYFAGGTLGGMIKTGHANTIGSRSVWLIPGPIHTDILVPLTPEARDAFGFLEPDVPLTEAEWLLIGWGARDFYTTTGSFRDVSARAVLRAVTGDRSVMRVEQFGPLGPLDGFTEISMDTATFSTLLDDIADSFAGPRLDVPGLSGDDHFFPGKGRFHVFRTCNVWVGRVLRDAGLRVGIWTPFTWSLP